MDVWQKRYEGLAAFICIGCAGPELAVAFSQRLQLRHTTVAVAEEEPRWGQLGCNGFIILDSQLNVVCSASAAYLEVRELAFRHVETVLDAVVAGSRPPRVCPGMEIRLKDLGQTKLNGTTGMCVGAPKGPDKRCAVLLPSGKTISVKEVNLITVSGQDDCGNSTHEDKQQSNCEDGSCALPNKKQKSGEQNCEGGNCALAIAPDPTMGKDADTASSAEMQIKPLGEIISVQVDDLDREHEQCVTALNNLVEHRTRDCLEKVLDVYRAHFSHEEQLLDRHMYADVAESAQNSRSGSGFSAAGGQRKSHFGDHTRMIKAIIQQLDTGDQTIGTAFIDSMLRDFENHANIYDDTYVAHLSAKMATASA